MQALAQARLASDEIPVGIIIGVQLVHRIAEQTSVLGLALVLSLQRRLLSRVCKNRTHSCNDFREACFSRSLSRRGCLGARVTQLAGIDLTGARIFAFFSTKPGLVVYFFS